MCHKFKPSISKEYLYLPGFSNPVYFVKTNCSNNLSTVNSKHCFLNST